MKPHNNKNPRVTMRPFLYSLIAFVGIVSVMIITPLCANDAYRVDNLKIDVQADDAIKAKTDAIKTARRNGFNVLMDRLGYMQDTAMISDDVINTMVNAVEINREKQSRNRYLASVNVVFNPYAVDGFLSAASRWSQPQTQLQTATVQPYNQNGLTQAVVPAQNGIINPSLGSASVAVTQTMQTFIIEAPLSGLNDYLTLSNRLQAIPQMSDVEINQLSSVRAVFQLAYAGDIYGLQQSLNASGYDLYQNATQGGIMKSSTSPSYSIRAKGSKGLF